ncbi:MAG: glycosyltransferase family 4 protein [Acidobacteriota bacterium]|nr:glycosyltransferase family 4 protein [Acidobacteriota bacterium]
MRIVIDATAAISGGKLYLEKLLPQLAEIDSPHEFIVFHVGDLDALATTIGGRRFHFYRVAIPLLRGGQWAGASVLRMLWRRFVLPTHLRRIEPDLLFSNSGTVPRGKPAKTKVIIALHNCMPLREELIEEEQSIVRRWRLRLLRRQMREALRACDGSIAFSEDTRLRIKKNFRELPHRPSVVHHGIDWGRQEREMPIGADDLWRLGLESPYLLYVSQFHRYKNVLRLLEAFAQVAVNHPALSLALVGAAADQDYWQEAEAAIARLNLQGRVKHLPACPREQLITVYRGALAFIQPSLAETCSFPLLEALALGVPTAAALMSALPEMAGDAAIYFDPYKVGEMAGAMERLVWDEALRDELSRKAIEQAAKFTWAETARQTLQVFEQVAGT